MKGRSKNCEKIMITRMDGGKSHSGRDDSGRHHSFGARGGGGGVNSTFKTSFEMDLKSIRKIDADTPTLDSGGLVGFYW